MVLCLSLPFLIYRQPWLSHAVFHLHGPFSNTWTSIPGYVCPSGCSSLFSWPTSCHLSNLSQPSAFSRKSFSGLGWNTLLGDLKDPLSFAELQTPGLLVTLYEGCDGWSVACSTQRANTLPHFSQGGWTRIRMMDSWSENCYPVTVMLHSRVSCPDDQVMGVLEACQLTRT